MAWLKNIGTDRETASFIDSIIENVADAILVIDRNGIVIGANPAAEEMTGWRVQELIDKVHFCQICKGVATCSAEITCSDCFATKLQVPSFEMRVRTKSGTEFPVAASSARLPESSQTAMVIILRDMSEQQRTERERYLRMMTNHVISAQEEERKRISRELHDGIGQAMYSILVGLKVINQLHLDEDVMKHLLTVQQMTAKALEEVKNLAVELRPSALDDLGLVPAVRSYLKRYEQIFGIETILEVEGQKRRYVSSIETALYRICQEALINAAKYADTDKILVQIRNREQSVTLRIEDYGCGFSTEEATVKGTGLGLYGIRERAHLLGGNVAIRSVIKEGTTIQIEIPVNEKGEPIHVDPGTYRR